MITLPFPGQPTREMLTPLSLPERVGYQVGALVNETRPGKWAASAYLTWFCQPWMRFLMDPVSVLVGVEHVPKDRAYILAANHRTFWDFYVTMCQIWPHMPRDHKPYLYCPVRSEFFYSKLVGTALNLAVSAHSMYPPIFRDDRGADLNEIAVQKCLDLLQFSPRTVIAIHPEGKRNKTDDPYALLPARSGVGRIALQSEAPVIPLFINGIDNDIGQILKNRQQPAPGTVRMHFGAPVDLSPWADRADDPAAHQEAAELIHRHIARLGDEERAARAAG
ncbi:MAG: 1-acyl-sn-glycerol-3-phosphate acyltransferase [Myxococcales bacterium]|nr:1-acyl-sn-glycerol-3-phosphate acyltransferase [Myxococcales bacterium]MCB9525144.1 1-acyl-sn-glycerol-3-phosphate acyltransferase [Myxococcales bacterium]